MSGRHRLWLPVLTAAALAASAAGAAAQPAPRSESAQENVRESEQYEKLLCSNAAFRAKRIKQECDSITDPQMHESCVASFQCGAGGPQQRRRSNKPPPSETIR